MSFTGRATYAELYPNHLLDNKNADAYGQGSVFRARGGQYFLLVQLAHGISLIILQTGNRWKDAFIDEGEVFFRACTFSQIRAYLNCNLLEYVGHSSVVLAINAVNEDS